MSPQRDHREMLLVVRSSFSAEELKKHVLWTTAVHVSSM